MNKIWCFLILVFVWSSCTNENILFEKNLPLEDALWKSDNMATFAFEVKDTISYYDIDINLRNNNSYPYSNIYLFVTIEFPNGKTHKDTLNEYLADATGKWYGTGIGDIYDNRYPLVDNLSFPIKGKYKVKIVQAMRKNDLKGIENVGLRVEKHAVN